MQREVIEHIREHNADLLDWPGLAVRTIKDPERPLSVVSGLGVPHGGMEKDSAVYRISDAERSFIVKRHAEPELFRREVANITFVNEAGGFAPEIAWADAETGIILMEDLGDQSLAWVWQRGDMAEYERWLRETVEIALQAQAHFHRREDRLRALYGDLSPDSPTKAFPPEEPLTQLDEALRISRGAALADGERDALLSIIRPMNERLAAFSTQHRTFCLGLSPWHIIRKDGRLRVIDLTFLPIGSVLGHFGNMTWHLDGERDIHRRYLDGRERLGLPPLDREEFLLLTDWSGLLGCVLWIRTYCRDILESEQALVDLRGERLTDYEANEAANLKAIYRALAPYPGLAAVADILERNFGRPLLKR